MTPPDWRTLEPAGKPNRFLSLPENFEATAVPHARSPVFPVEAAVLAAAFLRIALAEPRTRLVWRDRETRRYEIVQRSAVFRFPGDISVQVLAVSAHASSLALYSRARHGWFDFGVNRRRVGRWLGALATAIRARG